MMTPEDRHEKAILRKRGMRGAKRAWRHVYKAIKAGKLPAIDENTLCVDCGGIAKQYDHRDYNKTLDVEPVCYSCNRKRGHAKPYTGHLNPKKKYPAPPGISYSEKKQRWIVQVRRGNKSTVRHRKTLDAAITALREIKSELRDAA